MKRCTNESLVFVSIFWNAVEEMSRWFRITVISSLASDQTFKTSWMLFISLSIVIELAKSRHGDISMDTIKKTTHSLNSPLALIRSCRNLIGELEIVYRSTRIIPSLNCSELKHNSLHNLVILTPSKVLELLQQIFFWCMGIISSRERAHIPLHSLLFFHSSITLSSLIFFVLRPPPFHPPPLIHSIGLRNRGRLVPREEGMDKWKRVCKSCREFRIDEFVENAYGKRDDSSGNNSHFHPSKSFLFFCSSRKAELRCHLDRMTASPYKRTYPSLFYFIPFLDALRSLPSFLTFITISTNSVAIPLSGDRGKGQ